MYVNVSDVAAFIGQSKWDIVTPFERFWKNNDKEFNIILEELKNDATCIEAVKDTGLTRKEIISKYIGPEVMNSVLDDTTLTSSEKKTKIKEACGTNASNDCVESLVNTEHGIRNEEKVIKIIEETKKEKVDRSNKLYKKEISQGIVLCGRIDGLCDGYIVEVKNRMNGFFSSLREYENTQVQLYMWMLDGIEYTNLEEHYKGETKTTRVYKDEEYIEEIIERLQSFCDNLE
jgi:hypothetical protein